MVLPRFFYALSLIGCSSVVIQLAHASPTRGVCHQIAKAISNASAIYYPGDAEYATDFEHFAVTAELNSTCTVEPGTIQDVATILKLIGYTRTPFGIKGGGHNLNPGFSATTGVQLVMARFNEVTYHQDTQTVDVGLGLVWDAVYEALEPYNVSVVGGRATGVGVAGFSLGGGYSYKTNQYGLTVDNIVAFELVLPSGTIKTVTAISDPDLFFGLRGGGNNFGIVTQITMEAHPQTAVWGGTLTFDFSATYAVSAAVLKYTSTVNDPKTGFQCTFATALGQGLIMINLFYDAPSPPDGIFDDFLAIPAASSGVGTHTYLEIIQSANTQLTANTRGIYNTISHLNVTHIPSVFPNLMTFIGGPRGCIGFKFAEMSMKILMSVLIKSFVFSTTEKEIVWKVGVAEAPTVKGVHMLPLVVTPVKA